MSFTLQNVIDGILDRLNANADEFWMTANFLAYAKEFLRRTDVREACWHQAKNTSLTTVADQNEYNLPADFWRPDALFWTIDGVDYPLDTGSLGDRNCDPTWQIRGGKLWLEPAPTSDQEDRTLKLYYLRLPTAPTATTSTIDAPDDLEEAMSAFLLGRALEKAGPENAQRALAALQQTNLLIQQAKVARSDNRGDVGFQVRTRW